MRVVQLLFTGGTISMQHDAERGGNVPTLGGEALLALAPGIGELAECRVENWARLPACHMTQDTLTQLRSRVLELVADPAVDGIVITHGTDTLEETAYFLGRTVTTSKPIVVTGAMRTAGDPQWDGTRNLTDAVRVASSEESEGRGVMVVFHGHVLPGTGACKMDAMALDAFDAPYGGAIGEVGAWGVRYTGVAPMGPIHGVPADFALSAAVALVPAIVGDEGTMARLAFDHFDGLVLASYGCGNTPPRLAEAAYAWVEAGKPVVLASRCAAGEVTPAYGFEGGSATAVRHGVTLAGARTAAQARMELAIALSAGLRYDA